LRADLHIEGVRSALMGMLEGLLRDRLLSSRISYSASYDGADIRKLFLHVLNSFTTNDETLLGRARQI
jgi:hypothetical protein